MTSLRSRHSLTRLGSPGAPAGLPHPHYLVRAMIDECAWSVSHVVSPPSSDLFHATFRNSCQFAIGRTSLWLQAKPPNRTLGTAILGNGENSHTEGSPPPKTQRRANGDQDHLSGRSGTGRPCSSGWRHDHSGHDTEKRFSSKWASHACDNLVQLHWGWCDCKVVPTALGV